MRVERLMDIKQIQCYEALVCNIKMLLDGCTKLRFQCLAKASAIEHNLEPLGFRIINISANVGCRPRNLYYHTSMS